MSDSPSAAGPPIRLSFVRTTAFVAAGLALLSIGVYLGATRLGAALRLAGASSDTTPIPLAVGRHAFELPANTVRFAEQRTARPQDELDLYLAWPSLSGFTTASEAVFHDPFARSVLFVRLMTGASREPAAGPTTSDADRTGRSPEGLVRTLRRGLPAIASQEAVYRAPAARVPPYDAICLDGAEAVMAADCLREIRIGSDLRLRYRFSQALLPQWDAIDRAVLRYVAEHRRF